jgi:ribosomal protein L40E
MTQPKVGDTKQADMICRDCNNEFVFTIVFGKHNKPRCRKCNSTNIVGKKTWTPEHTKKETVNINLGWFDDEDVPAEDPNLPKLSNEQ